jgi:hypothetical protein
LLCIFLAVAMLLGTLTTQSWQALEKSQRILALFTTGTCFAGFLLLLLSLVEKSIE